jgi:hypothetical protein
MKLYLLNLNGAEAGPFTEKQIRSMWLTGGVTVSTPWRLPGGQAWIDGEHLVPIVESDSLAEPYKVSDETPAIQRRASLREDTAYPFARKLIMVLMGLFLLAAVIAWFLALGNRSEEGRGDLFFPIAVTLTAACYWALALVGLALLDVADSQLKES